MRLSILLVLATLLLACGEAKKEPKYSGVCYTVMGILEIENADYASLDASVTFSKQDRTVKIHASNCVLVQE